jgi:signal transduction histidine kinase/ligand-binding sensor domain-containing protein
MWFGTQYGLNRYDGYDFKLFVHDPRKENSLSGAFIFSLFKDRSGMLWIGCNQILDRFDPRTEQFTHYRIDGDDPGRLGGTVVHVSQDRRGMIWLASGTGLHQLDPATGAVTHYHHSSEEPQGLSTNDVRWSGEDRDGRFWVGTRDGLDEFDRANGGVLRHIPIPDAVQISFFEDRYGLFWILHASGNGLALYDRATNTLTPYSFYEADPPADAITGIMGMAEDPNGDLWLGSPGVGLLRFDRTNVRFLRYRNRPQDLHSIAEDKVIALFRDREGNMWTGLHSNGPNHFSRRERMFETFKHEPDDTNSLSEDFVNAIYEDGEGVLWIGNDAGLNRIDRRTGKRTLTTAGLGAKPMVISITGDSNGDIWFGTYGNGLTRYNPRSGRYLTYVHHPHDPTSLSDDKVHRVYISRTGILWAATDEGLNRFDPSTQKFTLFKVDPDQTGQGYSQIAEDQEGGLWLGSAHSGLHRFDPASERFTVYQPKVNELNSLRDYTVPAVFVSSTGVVWVGTQNGLNSFDPATLRFDAYDVYNGLPGNAVSCILEDELGNLWMSTNRGLSKFDPADKTFFNYSMADGLPGNDLTGWSTCYKGKRGELFFGGFSGAVAFFPGQMKDTDSHPSVVLTAFRLLGSEVPIGPNQLLTKSIGYTDELTLSHEQNFISFTFAGLLFSSPETIRYRYKLEGLGDRWYEGDSSHRRATFTTLPSGKYTFRVQAAGARSPWDEPGTTLNITVLPAWWATWWFRLIYGILIGLAIWFIYKMRLLQVARAVTIRMEERMNERARIAQDLHDTLLQGLMSASLQLAVAQNEIPLNTPGKSLVERVHQLLRQLIHEGRNTLAGLRVRRIETDEIEKAISLIPRDLGVENTVEFQVLSEGSPRTLKSSIRSDIYWIAHQAIANAFRHSKASLVEAVFHYSADAFRLVVRDNGIGIDAETLRTGRSGHFGLTGMTERAARIGARINILSAHNAGTEIELSLAGGEAFESRPLQGV